MGITGVLLPASASQQVSAAQQSSAVQQASTAQRSNTVQQASLPHPAVNASAYATYDAAVQALYARSLPDPSGQPQALAQYRGKVTVINFWASWCAPCVKEMPALSGLQRRYARQDVHFVGIGVDSLKNVSRYLTNATIDYPVYVAGFGGTELARQLGNATGGLPFTVVIDQAGHVRGSRLGAIDPAKLSRTLDALSRRRTLDAP
jgi:thiol-disulfide isomerase/thioredoxin